MSRYIDIEPYEKDGWYLQKHYHNSYGEVIKTTPLVSVPTAEAEPVKHGRWVAYEFGSERWHKCSVCGRGDGRGGRMSAKEMIEKIRLLKEQVILNGFRKTAEVDEFFNENWTQILDMLDDALYAYLQGKI